MTQPLVSLERRGAVATLTIDRPERLNALNVATLEALDDVVAQADADTSVHVLVITGAGDRAFVAGGDVTDLNSRNGLEHYLEFAELIHRVFRRIETLDKPTIAAVNGWALGGGTELLLCTDLRVMARSAKLGLPEITLGIFPGAGGTQRLLRQLPSCRAREILFLGDRISAETAAQLGLINHVVDDTELGAFTATLADRLAAKSPLTLKLLKRTLVDGLEMSPSAGLRYEQALIGLMLDSEDAHEGCSAFLEKRAPNWLGR